MTINGGFRNTNDRFRIVEDSDLIEYLSVPKSNEELNYNDMTCPTNFGGNLILLAIEKESYSVNNHAAVVFLCTCLGNNSPDEKNEDDIVLAEENTVGK